MSDETSANASANVNANVNEKPRKQPRYLIIARACEEDADGASAQVRIAAGKVDQENLQKLENLMIDMFEEQFGHLPGRSGVAVLPYVNELDGDVDGLPDNSGDSNLGDDQL